MYDFKELGKILVVEDSSSITELIKFVLEEDGYAVLCASSGEEALEIISSNVPDLILLDIIMPGIDGYETCTTIKGMPLVKEVPIIFMSVLDESFSKVKAFECGAADYIMKPIDTQELLSRVQTHLTMKRLVDELKAAKEKAEDASLAKGAFLANMSHEIRTPVNGIMGFTYLIRNSKLSERQREQINYIDLSCQHLLSVINDILDLSKIEAGKLKLEKRGFHLPTLVQAVVKTLTPDSRKKKLKLNFHVDPRVPQNLIGDPTRLRQVLFNLIYNAIKFTGAGMVSLNCSEKKRTGNDVMLQFSVTDTGIGLTKEKFDRIFERFAQADLTTSNKYGGTGLGLSISKQLVDLMGGRIWVDSAPSAGSQFNFTVQFKIQHGQLAAVQPAESASTGDSEDTQTGTAPVEISDNEMNTGDDQLQASGDFVLNILLVEDNHINMKLASNLLEKMGHHVTPAENGAMAVEMVKKKPFDIVFMDIQMPVMDGIEATQQIRQWEVDQECHIPIIAMTAHAMQGDCERFLESGMNDYISKPFDPELLKIKIQNAVAALNSRPNLKKSISRNDPT